MPSISPWNSRLQRRLAVRVIGGGSYRRRTPAASPGPSSLLFGEEQHQKAQLRGGSGAQLLLVRVEDLLGQVRRHGAVLEQLHGEGAASLGRAAQGRGVGEHLGDRH